MARKRIENEIKLKSWDDVDMNLMEILENEIQIEHLNGEMNLKIAEIKEDYKSKIEPLNLKIKLLARELQDYTEAHRDEMGGKKSKTFTHGTVSFRKSTKVSVPTKILQDAIKKLETMHLNNCIMIKKSINKDELKKQPVETLIKVGASLKTDDVFGYETDKSSIPK